MFPTSGSGSWTGRSNMKFIADLHIHSHFSIATSGDLNPGQLELWAAKKGITVVSTGDFTHPGWTKELEEKLEPAEPGLFRLKPCFRHPESGTGAFSRDVRFILSAEISTIYKKGDRTRKVHHVLLAPDFGKVTAIQNALSRIGNITSDGRPILGLDSRDLLEIVLKISEEICFIPAHIWTPWFSALGAKSGFDTIEECYRDLCPHIYAVETGLSSDPPMNWTCSFLDRYTLVSNSDAHSPEKLGREANLFDTELSYEGITGALKSGNAGRFLGTIEFFPQEGKYHYDGHRKCGICWDPLETGKHGGLCTVCGKPVTVGVMNRVAQLSDRENIEELKRSPFYSLIPLKEILSEITGVSASSKQVAQAYHALIGKAGSEFNILLHMSPEELGKLGNDLLTEAVRRMRAREIFIEEGYDGEYGRIRTFREEEIRNYGSPDSLFGEGGKMHSPNPPSPLVRFDLKEYRIRVKEGNVSTAGGVISEKLTPDGVPPERLAPGKVPSEIRTPGGIRPDRLPEERVPSDRHPRRGVPPDSPAGVELSEKQASSAERDSGMPGLPDGSLLEGLDQEQRSAVAHFQGPVMIVAGPGTGKTRVLTHRIAWLISRQGVPPEKILAVTFTNRAAGEMKDRLNRLLGKGGEERQVFTFHAFGYRLLCLYHQKLGRDLPFTVVDENERLYILKEQLGIESSSLKRISGAVKRFKQISGREPIGEDPAFRETILSYDAFLEDHNLFDLDDLVSKPVNLLKEDPVIAEEIRDRYRFLLVDEYQDINEAQYSLLRFMMPEPQSNLCVIGDPHQAIYGFRGSDLRFTDAFLNDYRAKVYTLKKSYRCSGRILKAAGQVVTGERGGGAGAGIVKESPEWLSGMEEGLNIAISGHPTEKSEAEFVARTIESLMGGLRFFSMDSDITEGEGVPESASLSDFAVLARTHQQMGALEKAMIDHSIPFQSITEGPFFRTEPACTLIRVLKGVMNPKYCFMHEMSGNTGSIAKDIKLLKPTVRETLLEIEKILFTGEHESKEDFQRLLSTAGDFGGDMEGFIRFVTLGMETDLFRPHTEQVTLMTLHAAKGLEFSCVFITGCEEGLIPFSLHPGRESDREEERRLLYVGMTRAKHRLFLTHAEKRFLWGREHCLKRSSFLDTIEEALIERLEVKRAKGRTKKEDGQMGLF